MNGAFTRASNCRHGRCGHLLEGRYKAILNDADAYLLEFARYIVPDPGAWPWSRYRART
ncbi:MAG: hypothetical protein KDG53_18290 [Rhodocyclaceae bacterium]|nr:hypothetical protein [Rhodocyclaceae bacterium]